MCNFLLSVRDEVASTIKGIFRYECEVVSLGIDSSYILRIFQRLATLSIKDPNPNRVTTEISEQTLKRNDRDGYDDCNEPDWVFFARNNQDRISPILYHKVEKRARKLNQFLVYLLALP